MTANFTQSTFSTSPLDPVADGFHFDVLVVGLGPGGATAALALARYGVRVHAVSMYPWVANSPRAHIFNQRAAEVMRDLGVEAEVMRRATPWDQMGDTLLTTSLAGPELLRIRSWGTGDDQHGAYVRASPCQMVDIPQPDLEPILVDAAFHAGAALSFNTQYLSHDQDDEGVTVSLRDTRTGHVFEQRVRYLVGFDGARSQIAERLELPFVGELARAGTVYTQFEADLSAYVAHRPSILNWIFNAEAGHGEIGMGLLRAVEPWTKWIAGWGLDASNDAPDLTEETVTARIRALIGDPEVDIKVDRTTTWFVNEQYATRFQAGRVLLGGDAVHRHPPSNGLGANTTIQDAFNLAWKVAFVVRGAASPSLLESYSDERVPVGAQVVARANQSRRDFAPLREWLDPSETDPVGSGHARLVAPTADGAQLRDQLYRALIVKNHEFNAHGVELNHRYASGAVLPDADCAPEVFTDAELTAQHTTRPGAKLPHAWLVGKDGKRLSTLDVVGNGAFTLVTGLSGSAWVEAVTAIDVPWLTSVVIGEPGSEDPYGEWWLRREIDESGALLVRPDAYIAWRASTGPEDTHSAAHQLRTALQSILGKAHPSR